MFSCFKTRVYEDTMCEWPNYLPLSEGKREQKAPQHTADSRGLAGQHCKLPAEPALLFQSPTQRPQGVGGTGGVLESCSGNNTSTLPKIKNLMRARRCGGLYPRTDRESATTPRRKSSGLSRLSGGGSSVTIRSFSIKNPVQPGGAFYTPVVRTPVCT